MDSRGIDDQAERGDLINPVQASTVNRILEEVVGLREQLENLPLKERTSCLIAVKEVARRLGVSIRHVETQIALRLIIPIWIGGVRRFDPRSVDAFIKSARRGTKKPSS